MATRELGVSHNLKEHLCFVYTGNIVQRLIYGIFDNSRLHTYLEPFNKSITAEQTHRDTDFFLYFLIFGICLSCSNTIAPIRERSWPAGQQLIVLKVVVASVLWWWLLNVMKLDNAAAYSRDKDDLLLSTYEHRCTYLVVAKHTAMFDWCVHLATVAPS